MLFLDRTVHTVCFRAEGGTAKASESLFSESTLHRVVLTGRHIDSLRKINDVFVESTLTCTLGTWALNMMLYSMIQAGTMYKWRK